MTRDWQDGYREGQVALERIHAREHTTGPVGSVIDDHDAEWLEWYEAEGILPDTSPLLDPYWRESGP